MHASLENDDLTIMASEMMPGMKLIKGTNVSLSLVGNDAAKLKGFFEKLSAGGTVTMPMEKQFWGDVFGMFTDKFGIHWMVNVTEREA
jgi:PhnB protein